MPITKRHKSTLMSGIVVALGASMLAGCAADPIAVPKSETYTRDFIKTFGTFDQSHDWNHATQATVNVTTAKATDIKIYALVDNVRYLFGTYLGVEGQRTLSVDIPKGTTDLIVRANGIDHNVKPGGSLSLKGSRLIHEAPVVDETHFMTVVDAGTVIEAAHDYVALYDKMLPEDKKNLSKPGVNVNFRFDNPGKSFIVYPVLWQTANNNTIGVYYYDSEGVIHKQPFYEPKGGDYLQYRYVKYSSKTDTHNQILDNDGKAFTIIKPDGLDFINECISGVNEANYGNNNKYWINNDGGVQKLVWNNSDFASLKSALESKGYKISSWENPGEWTNCNTDNEYANFYPKAEVILEETKSFFSDQYTFGPNAQLPNDEGTYISKGIKITIPKEIEQFGMYISNSSGILYSESQLNTEYKIDWRVNWHDESGNELPEGEVIEGQPETFAPGVATFMKAGFNTSSDGLDRLRRIGFEDAYIKGLITSSHGSNAFGDFNDIIIYIEGLNESIETGEIGKDIVDISYNWIIACEDLGTDDFDFNDVVFGVGNYVEKTENGKTTQTVDIYPLAAGGTLPVYLLYDGKHIIPDGTNAGEFHSWFGNYPSSKVINAKTFEKPTLVYTLPVLSNFTLECCKIVENGSGNMGGFQVKVVYPSGDVTIEATNPNLSSKIGEAPQMICVPYDWFWPVENKLINTVYEDFTKWCENGSYDASLGWHKNRTGSPVSHYVHRTISTSSSSSSGITGDSSILTREDMEDLWGGKRYKYTINSQDLQNASSISISVSYLNAPRWEAYDINNNRLSTIESGEITGNDLETVKRDGCFTLVFFDYKPEHLSVKVTVRINK